MAVENKIENVKIYIGKTKSGSTINYNNIKPSLSAADSYKFADTMSAFNDFEKLSFVKVITSSIE